MNCDAKHLRTVEKHDLQFPDDVKPALNVRKKIIMKKKKLKEKKNKTVSDAWVIYLYSNNNIRQNNDVCETI